MISVDLVEICLHHLNW